MTSHASTTNSLAIGIVTVVHTDLHSFVLSTLLRTKRPLLRHAHMISFVIQQLRVLFLLSIIRHFVLAALSYSVLAFLSFICLGYSYFLREKKKKVFTNLQPSGHADRYVPCNNDNCHDQLSSAANLLALVLRRLGVSSKAEATCWVCNNRDISREVISMARFRALRSMSDATVYMFSSIDL